MKLLFAISCLTLIRSSYQMLECMDDYSIRPYGNYFNGMCACARTLKKKGKIVLADCDDTDPGQQWMMMEDGCIKSYSSDWCWYVRAKHGKVKLARCDSSDEKQIFELDDMHVLHLKAADETKCIRQHYKHHKLMNGPCGVFGWGTPYNNTEAELAAEGGEGSELGDPYCEENCIEWCDDNYDPPTCGSWGHCETYMETYNPTSYVCACEANYGGPYCDVVPTDCGEWYECSWSDWSACDGTCGGGNGFANHELSCTNLEFNSPCGTGASEGTSCVNDDMCNCGDDGELYACNWSAWSDCGCLAESGGSRSRHLECTFHSNSEACSIMAGAGQSETCTPETQCMCGDDGSLFSCFWADWSACDGTCGGGIGARTRGMQCEFNTFGQECNAGPGGGMGESCTNMTPC